MRLEDCPVRAALDVIGGKWKPVVLYHLMDGPKRHGELRQLRADASQNRLTQQPRELGRRGVIADHRRADIGTYPRTGKPHRKPEYRTVSATEADYYDEGEE